MHVTSGRSRLAFVILCSATLACNGSSRSGGAAPTANIALPASRVWVDQTSYRIEHTASSRRATIVIFFENGEPVTVYLPRCGDAGPLFRLDRLIDGRWRQSYSPVCQLVQAPPIQVEPGRTWTDTIRIVEPREPRPSRLVEAFNEPGDYRVVIGGARAFDSRAWKFSDFLPESVRASGTFRFRL